MRKRTNFTGNQPANRLSRYRGVRRVLDRFRMFSEKFREIFESFREFWRVLENFEEFCRVSESFSFFGEFRRVSDDF